MVTAALFGPKSIGRAGVNAGGGSRPALRAVPDFNCGNPVLGSNPKTINERLHPAQLLAER